MVGVRPPDHWAAIEALGEQHRLVAEAARWGRVWQRPAVAADSIAWDALNVVPRFVGSESTTCVAALQPSVFHAEGADEFERFLGAVGRRGETALVVSTIGDLGDTRRGGSVFGRNDASISLPGAEGHIAGRRLPDGAAPELAAGLTGADRDLALRLRSAAQTWWAIELADTEWEGAGGRGVHHASGAIEPLLVSELGEVLAGVWIPGRGRDWRWYVLPDGVDWNMSIAWCAERAAPEFVPGALRRARSVSLVDAELRTPAELAAMSALETFDRETLLARGRLESALTSATNAADVVRHDLLYGTGDVLKDAVAFVLRQAGLHVEDLDVTFGAGRSSDLLVGMDGVGCLVEVKSASGRPSESMLDDLERHRRTWASLGRTDALHRTALVVNHQTNLAPLSRATRPYERQEFLDSLQHAVVPALALYRWWRDENFDALRGALLLGPIRQHEVDLNRGSMPGTTDSSAVVAQATAPSDREPRRRSLWRPRDSRQP